MKKRSNNLLKFLDCSSTVGKEGTLLSINILFTVLENSSSKAFPLELDLKEYQEILKRKSCRELSAVTSFIVSYIVVLQLNNSLRYYSGLKHKFSIAVSCSAVMDQCFMVRIMKSDIQQTVIIKVLAFLGPKKKRKLKLNYKFFFWLSISRTRFWFYWGLPQQVISYLIYLSLVIACHFFSASVKVASHIC